MILKRPESAAEGDLNLRRQSLIPNHENLMSQEHFANLFEGCVVKPPQIRAGDLRPHRPPQFSDVHDGFPFPQDQNSTAALVARLIDEAAPIAEMLQLTVVSA